MRTLVLPIATAALLAACAQTPAETARAQQDLAASQAALAKELAGLVPQGEQTCLPNLRDYHLSSYGPTLVYSVSRSLKYRNDTGGGCENVARGDTLVTVSNQGQLCQGDIAQTVQPVARIPTGSCGLGTFVRYGKP